MIRAAALAACGLLAACATGGPNTAVSPTDGYLDDADIARLAATAIPRATDMAVEALPGEPGTDRWWLATAHAELRPPWAAQHFDCVLETRLAAAPRPALNRLMARVLADSEALTRRMAERAPRARPVADGDLEPCQRINDATRAASSWPAGGAVAGAAYGEMFAALAPDRADGARHMGREIGLSRAMCRMNWPSDVDDGALAGQALYATLGHDPAFVTDLEAARSEVVAARAEGLSSPACAAERRALAG